LSGTAREGALVAPIGTAVNREHQETTALVLAQPHRRGSDDPMLSGALGGFCALHGRHLYEAGLQYRDIIHDDRAARWGPSDRTEMSDAELRARRDLADKHRQDADKILDALDLCDPGALPELMVWVYYNDRWAHPYDEDILLRGLAALSDAWGLSPRGRQRERAAALFEPD
jgi:hypothetical protein